MRRLSLLLSVSLLALSCGASARTMPYPQIDDTAGSTVQVRAPAATFRMTDDQARQMSAAYEMSNGWRLKVEPVSRSYIDARIDREKPMRLRAIGAGKFVSRDGKLSMQFNQGEFGDEMTMSFVADARLAQVVTISSRMAQR